MNFSHTVELIVSVFRLRRVYNGPFAHVVIEVDQKHGSIFLLGWLPSSGFQIRFLETGSAWHEHLSSPLMSQVSRTTGGETDIVICQLLMQSGCRNGIVNIKTRMRSRYECKK